MSEKIFVIPPPRTRYLSEIAENNRAYDKNSKEQVEVAQNLYGIYKTICSVLDVSSSTAETTFLDKNGLNYNEILKQVQ